MNFSPTVWGLALLLTTVGPMTGCGNPSGTSGTQPAAAVKNDPHAVEQAAMEQATLDFSRVVVVRLKKDGKRLEVTSIMPLVVAETLVSGQPAKTVFRLSQAGDGLVMFSRDLPKGASFRIEIRFDELRQKKAFTFPVVQKDGSLLENRFELEQIITPS